MKFTADRIALLAAAQKAASAASKKSCLPILETLKLTLDDGNESKTATLTGTDLKTYCIARFHLCDLEYDGQDAVCIPATRFIKILSTLKTVLVTLETDGCKIHVHTDTGTYTMTGEDAKEFPVTPDPTDFTDSLQLDDDLRQALARATVFVSEDELREAMCGVHLENNYEQLHIVATDGHRLYCKRLQERNLYPWQATLNTHALSIALKYNATLLELSLTAEPAEATAAQYTCHDLIILSRCTDEHYPNWRSVIPAAEGYVATAVLQRKQTLAAIKLVTQFASAAKHVKLTFSEHGSTVSTADVDFGGEATEQLTGSFTWLQPPTPELAEGVEGEPAQFCIGFNADYLTDLFTTLSGDSIGFRLTSPTRAAICSPADNDDEILILMPLRLNVDKPYRPPQATEPAEVVEFETDQEVEEEELAG